MIDDVEALRELTENDMRDLGFPIGLQRKIEALLNESAVKDLSRDLSYDPN